MSNELTDILRKIEAVSVSLEMRGRWIADDVNRVVNLPSWETQAEDTLARAEHQLRRTHGMVKQAQILLQKKRPQRAAE